MRIEKITRRGKEFAVLPTHSTFINMSYRAVVEEGGIPLSLHLPNAETARVLRDARKSTKRAKYTKAATLDEFNASLGRRPKR